MTKVCIIGGGFGGLTAAKRLSVYGHALDCILIDRKETSDFLPTLPDCIGRSIRPDCLTYNINDMAKRCGFKFLKDEVVAIDMEKREVATRGSRLNYDYLIIASGSETNFYGNENIRQNSLNLDGADDAENIVNRLKTGEYRSYVIVGGGYTGVEVATNLRIFLDKNKKPGRIIIVERAPSILGALPEWMKAYVSSNLKRLDVEILTGSQIEKIDGRRVYIAGREALDDAVVIWAAGVKTSGFIQNMNVKKSPQGRVEVDEYLRLNDRCFVIGDAAFVKYGDTFLRMAVQFSIVQGEMAARNIIKSILKRKLRKYRPVDLGYIIPMANNRSCGSVFGLNIKGFIPTVFHFIMCMYRFWDKRKAICLLRTLLS